MVTQIIFMVNEKDAILLIIILFFFINVSISQQDFQIQKYFIFRNHEESVISMRNPYNKK